MSSHLLHSFIHSAPNYNLLSEPQYTQILSTAWAWMGKLTHDCALLKSDFFFSYLNTDNLEKTFKSQSGLLLVCLWVT